MVGGWARPEYERERKQAAKAGLLVGIEEREDGTMVLQVLAPSDNIIGVLRLIAEHNGLVFIHRTTKPGYKLWQVTYFEADLMSHDASFDHLQEALDSVRAQGFIIDALVKRATHSP